MIDKVKADKKLRTLTWEELDWLEQKCRLLKANAGGIRFYSSDGDSTHRAEAVSALSSHFDDVLYKHHGV